MGAGSNITYENQFTFRQLRPCCNEAEEPDKEEPHHEEVDRKAENRKTAGVEKKIVKVQCVQVGQI